MDWDLIEERIERGFKCLEVAVNKIARWGPTIARTVVLVILSPAFIIIYIIGTISIYRENKRNGVEQVKE
jgi:hypothetical protein